MNRIDGLNRLYELLDDLRARVGGYRYLGRCSGRDDWPMRGVYFFFEESENREIGSDLRVVRVGTHAITTGSRRTLWSRLYAHKGHVEGTHPGGGNHRGSIFRWHVGGALLRSRGYPARTGATWLLRDPPGGRAVVRDAEYPLERDVSTVIGTMPFLWVAVPDDPGPGSDRRFIEANCIALLSNRSRAPVDPPSQGWLGLSAENPKVRDSGLWLDKHVDDDYDLAFLSVLALYVVKMRRG